MCIFFCVKLIDINGLTEIQRGMCIKGLFWPPLEPKTEILLVY